MPEKPVEPRAVVPTEPEAVSVSEEASGTDYRPGHEVHWMQALHTANKPEVRARSWRGLLLGVTGDILTVEREDGQRVSFRNHDPERLLAIAGRLPSGVLINEQYAILRVGSYCFSVQAVDGQPVDDGPLHDDAGVAAVAPPPEQVPDNSGGAVRPAGTASRP